MDSRIANRKRVEVLERNSVAYAVIGAMAAAIYGVVRASMDADTVAALEKLSP